jgi:hypothetical protein
VSADVLDRIRAACAEVHRRARFVRIDAERLRALAAELGSSPAPASHLDPAHQDLGSREATLAYVLTLDAINFGSGWFPTLRKRPGLSGYFTIATGLRERFEAKGPWSAEELCGLTAADCASTFGQDLGVPEAAELMGLFARALADLGRLIVSRHAGRFEGPVVEAEGSAAALVEILARMPFYRDVSRYEELEVPLYKRAQLTASDLAAAFRGEGPGRFRDLDRLTLFADNLVPHVLRREGVLVYEASLARRVDAEELVPAGSLEEVEIRAVSVHAVERCVAEIARGGGRTTAQVLDTVLWNRGQRPELKAHPRHRTRSVYY